MRELFDFFNSEIRLAEFGPARRMYVYCKRYFVRKEVA